MTKILNAFVVLVIILTTFSPSTTEAAKRGRLEKIISANMLDVDLAYFERAAGIAKKTYDNTKDYDIDGCLVTATIEKGSVVALRVELSSKCTFNLNKFIGYKGKFPPPHKMTFGQFQSLIDGTFMANYLTDGGNTYEPVIYVYWHGDHSDGWRNVLLEVQVVVNDDARNALQAWENAMRKSEGENYVTDKMFNCDYKYHEIAEKAFRNVKISAITIGINVDSDAMISHISPCNPRKP